MRFVVTSGALVLSAALAAPALGGPIFMQYEGVNGDAIAADHKDWIEVQSYQWATPPPAAPRAPAPAGVAVGGPGRVSLVRRVDKASPLLRKAATTGKLVPAVNLDVPKTAGQGTTPYMRYELKNVMVSSYSNAGVGLDDVGRRSLAVPHVSSAGSAAPTETLSLNYTKIEYRYAEQKAPPKFAAPNRAAGAGNMSAAPAPSPTRPAK